MAKQRAVRGAACACAGSERKALAVDATTKKENVTRLRRIEGQVRGLQRMVEEERYCADVITQISSVQEALRSVSRAVLRNHLRHCATTAIRQGGRAADEMYDELVELASRGTR